MTENKRTKVERRRDLLEIAKMYLNGYTHWQIAKKLPEVTGANYTLSQPQITYDIQKLIKHWQESQLQSIGEKVAIELERINRIEQLAAESFEMSRLKSVKKTKKINTDNSAGEDDDEGTKVTKKAELSVTEYERYGNHEFLKIMLQCGAERRKLLGLDAAIKLDIVSVSSSNYATMSEKELDNYIIELEKLTKGESGEGEIIDITPKDEG
jgi:hypothetical protein